MSKFMNTFLRIKVIFFFFILILSISDVRFVQAATEEKEVLEKCPEALLPPPSVLKADMPVLIESLEKLKTTNGKSIWTKSDDNVSQLKDIFEAQPQKTKLEQFFQLLFSLQKNIPETDLPITIQSSGIVDVLLAAKVFKDPSFPKEITEVTLKKDSKESAPQYKVTFGKPEVRFRINEGAGFSSWDQGMCQIAKELVFYPGFSFRLRQARNSKNLVVDDFNKVEIFGQFGTRKVFSIDLSYVDLEKVEFIRGTDQGKVKARVADREFQTNEHSKLFKFIGTMVPNTSTQRIDW